MKLIKVAFILFIGSFLAKAQNDVIISGNSSSSALVCSSGKIYAWGNNQVYFSDSIPYKGVLGVGSMKTYESIPTPVIGNAKFNNLSFKQICGGSGNHFIALACNGSVWTWGSNNYKQLGTAMTDSILIQPTQVKAGVLTGTAYDDGSGFLTGVKMVKAGNTNSFALLPDGRMVSWGSNSIRKGTAGMLGDGSEIDRPTPVFVIDGKTKLPLTNVIDISPGENATYGLIDDNSDGVGTVYSWGYGINGILGRNVDGTVYSSFQNTNISSYAFPVRIKNGSTLSGITAISAGDVFMMALDVDGYVWSWGNSAWGGCTGQGPLYYLYTGGEPRKVLRGETIEKGVKTQSFFLKAKSIAGGQGFAMAVTLDGKAVSWGNNGGCNNGGYLGGGSSETFKWSPNYIINSVTNKVDSNVVTINRGDQFGFYTTNDKKIFAWGCNLNGQLGIGNSISINKAVPLSLPNICEVKDLKPYAKFLTLDTILCKSALGSNPLFLRPNLSISDSLAKYYQGTWYSTDGIVKGPLIASNPESRFLKTNKTGIYTFKLNYIGSKGDCNGYPFAETSINVKGYIQEFTIPAFPSYKGDTLKPKVTKATYPSSLYAWYGSSASTLPFAISKGTNVATIARINPDITSSGNGDITLYVEESSAITGSVLKSDSVCDANFKGSIILRNDTANTYSLRTQYVAFDKIKLSSFKILLKTKIPNPGTLSGQLNFTVYASKFSLSYNEVIPDTATRLGTFRINFIRTRSNSDSANNNFELTVPVNINIPGNIEGYYFYVSLADKALTNKIGQGIVSVGFPYCNMSFPVKDDGTGTILLQNGTQTGTNTSKNNEPGMFFDLRFETGQRFCERIPVTFKPEVVTGLNEDETKNSAIDIYPNPANHICIINVPTSGTLHIYNLQGIEVLKKNVMKGPNNISLNELPKSSYVVKFSDSNIQQRTKLIIE